jgi:hypothetical protein
MWAQEVQSLSNEQILFSLKANLKVKQCKGDE